MSERLLIQNGLIYTMNKQNEIIQNGGIIIKDGRIEAVDKISKIRKEYKVDNIIDATHKAIIPGLISSHFHSHIFTRGLIDAYLTLGLKEALEKFYYPVLRESTEEDVYIEALLSYAESIKFGITCVNDMYCKMEGCAKAAEEIGIRAVLSEEAADLIEGPSLKENEELFRKRNNSAEGRISVWFGVEWIPVCSPEFMLKARELANKYHTGIHIHLCESLDEIEYCKKNYDKNPAEIAYEYNVLGKDVVAAHCVWPSNKEVELLSKTKTSVAHCPVMNMKSGGGIAPVPEMISQGVNVSMGTDAFFYNMIEGMKYASLIQKVSKLDPSLLPPEQVLSMATRHGAKALQLYNEIGTIEKGKKADLCILDLNSLHFQPLLYGKYFNVTSNLIYTCSTDDIETVLIDGQIVLQKRRLVTINEEEIKKLGRQVAFDIFERAKIFNK